MHAHSNPNSNSQDAVYLRPRPTAVSTLLAACPLLPCIRRSMEADKARAELGVAAGARQFMLLLATLGCALLLLLLLPDVQAHRRGLLLSASELRCGVL